jgi:feruloyl esterase
VNTERRSVGLFVAAGALVTITAPAAAQNGAQFTSWKTTALAESVQLMPRASCSALVAQTGYDVSITSATLVPASHDSPAYCRVRGQVLPEVQFEVSLPDSWNGRLYMFGNGGYAGEPLDAPPRAATTRLALARGFAVAQTNTGHSAAVEPLGTFAASPQKFLDYAFRAVHVTVVTAKRLLETYYQQPPRRSYFDGCSTGGRQGLISAQRFPDDFDGIVAGAPVLDFSGTMISYTRTQRALAAGPIPAGKLTVLADAVAARCDRVDGLADGLIDDPRRCPFAPAMDLPRCAGDTDGPNCFTTAQIRTLETIYTATTRAGEEVSPGWPVGTEARAAGAGGDATSAWVPWFVAGGANARPVQALFGETFFQNMAFGRPSPGYDWTTFDVERDYDKLGAARAALDATDPDLSRFKARGGKILSYFGWADPALNPLMGVRYYERVMERFGSQATDFYRLFMVPGMFHCRGGVGVSTFDALTPLVEWVERGVAPASIAAARIVSGSVVRTRPLCPHPQVARYRGSGSIDDQASFACVAAGPQ